MTTINKTPSIVSKPNLAATPLFDTNYKVYINHTDAGGIVYHANHLVFFENCRRDWFTKLGLNGYFLQTNDGEIQHFVVSQADLQYKRAILLDEIINLRIDKVELKPASIVFYQSIHRHLDPDNTTEDIPKNSKSLLLSSGKIVIACVQNQITPDSITNDEANKTTNNAAPMRPIRVPQKLRDAIEQAIFAHKE